VGEDESVANVVREEGRGEHGGGIARGVPTLRSDVIAGFGARSCGGIGGTRDHRQPRGLVAEHADCARRSLAAGRASLDALSCSPVDRYV